jgi:inosine-uridine nucleoside N-ribohydrolase|tara:strand:+ start:79 stop:918 length:840 start_codon:yes stop_codon:yes gene_type:complete
MKKANIILDCDTKNEIDDQFAIVYALKSPEINLLGVVSVQNTKKHGIKSVDKYHNEAKKILRLSNSKIPAFKGSRNPLKSKNKPEKSSGVDFIISTALKSKEKIFVVGTGPCTNLVNACLIEPKIKKKCKFIWLGGFRNNQEIKNFKSEECNFDGDKFATKILMDLDIDLTLLPAWGVTDRMISQCPSFIESLQKKNTPVSNYLAKLIKDTKKRFWIFWDIAAPAVAKNFGVISKKQVPACKVINGKLYFPSKNKRKITLIDSIDELEILKQAKKYILR